MDPTLFVRVKRHRTISPSGKIINKREHWRPKPKVDRRL